MPVKTIYKVFCDKCQREEVVTSDETNDFAYATTLFLKIGWVISGEGSNKGYYCPKCAKTLD